MQTLTHGVPVGGVDVGIDDAGHAVVAWSETVGSTSLVLAANSGIVEGLEGDAAGNAVAVWLRTGSKTHSAHRRRAVLELLPSRVDIVPAD